MTFICNHEKILSMYDIYIHIFIYMIRGRDSLVHALNTVLTQKFSDIENYSKNSLHKDIDKMKNNLSSMNNNRSISDDIDVKKKEFFSSFRPVSPVRTTSVSPVRSPVRNSKNSKKNDEFMNNTVYLSDVQNLVNKSDEVYINEKERLCSSISSVMDKTYDLKYNFNKIKINYDRLKKIYINNCEENIDDDRSKNNNDNDIKSKRNDNKNYTQNRNNDCKRKNENVNNDNENKNSKNIDDINKLTFQRSVSSTIDKTRNIQDYHRGNITSLFHQMNNDDNV